MYRFSPQVKIVGHIREFNEASIKREPMLFSASKEFAMRNGGAITQHFVKMFLQEHDDWIIDSRVHMLMPGWYPCIPGWHHDDVPRSTKDGQPNYDNPEYHSEHIMCVIGKSAMPEFLNCATEMPKPEGVTYGVWNEHINKKYLDGAFTVTSNKVYHFTWQDFHRGMPATENCWRFFIRASRNTTRPFLNEIRSQVQVYLPALEEGW